MARENKRYYWLRFQEDFFSSLRVKKLKKLGSDYLIIYLEMQLLSIRTGGYLEYKGIEDTFAKELALELDEDPDKVQLTLSFLQTCHLLECTDENEFFLPYVEKNTGSETASTQRSRECREKKRQQKLLQCNTDATQVQQELLQCNTSATQTQRTCNVEKEKDIDKKKTLSKERVKEKVATQHFSAPTLEEVQVYAKSISATADAELFFDYYQARDWKGIKDWKASFRVWEKREQQKAREAPESSPAIKKSMFKEFAQREYDFNELEEKLINRSG